MPPDLFVQANCWPTSGMIHIKPHETCCLMVLSTGGTCNLQFKSNAELMAHARTHMNNEHLRGAFLGRPADPLPAKDSTPHSSESAKRRSARKRSRPEDYYQDSVKANSGRPRRRGPIRKTDSDGSESEYASNEDMGDAKMSSFDSDADSDSNDEEEPASTQVQHKDLRISAGGRPRRRTKALPSSIPSKTPLPPKLTPAQRPDLLANPPFDITLVNIRKRLGVDYSVWRKCRRKVRTEIRRRGLRDIKRSLDPDKHHAVVLELVRDVIGADRRWHRIKSYTERETKAYWLVLKELRWVSQQGLDNSEDTEGSDGEAVVVAKTRDSAAPPAHIKRRHHHTPVSDNEGEKQPLPAINAVPQNPTTTVLARTTMTPVSSVHTCMDRRRETIQLRKLQLEIEEKRLELMEGAAAYEEKYGAGFEISF